jgi:recombination protein RecT
MTTPSRPAPSTAPDTVPAVVTPKQAIAKIVETNHHAIALSLPSGMNPDRFGRLLLTAANTNPDLFKCDPRSFLAAGVAAAQLGLEPNDARGLAYLIPFGNKVQLVIGYRGYIDLARRSGHVSSLYAFPVFEGDLFTYTLGLDPTLEHVPAEDSDEDPAKLTHVYAVAKIGDDKQFTVLTRKQVDKARQRSKTGGSSSSPWSTDYVAMACKTAVRRLAKYLPLSVEAARATTIEDQPLSLSDAGAILGMDDGDDGRDPIDVGEVQHIPAEAS